MRSGFDLNTNFLIKCRYYYRMELPNVFQGLLLILLNLEEVFKTHVNNWLDQRALGRKI